jgi:protein-disulfide isomerase
MRTDGGGGRLSGFASWTLVFCAFLTTILVVRREFFSEASPVPTANPIKRQAVHVDEWQEVLAAGIRLGSADALVQVVEFADFQCPGCARYEATVRKIRDKYPGDEVAFTFAHYPLIYHDSAESAARAAECAHVQGRFEAMRSLLFQRQQVFGSVPWTDFARQVSVPDIEQFDACVNDTRPLQRVEQGKTLGDAIGVRATPTIIVNGWMVPGLPSPEDFDEIVNNIVDGRPPTADMY